MAHWKELLFEDKSDWIGPKIMRFLLDKPAILLTATYVLTSGLGLLYQYVLFASFGINVIDYAKSEDLFLAAFKNPNAMLSGLGIGASMVFYRFVARYAKQRQSRIVRFALLWFSWIGLLRREILIPLGMFYFLFFYASAAELEGRRIVELSNDVVNVVIKTNSAAFSLLPIGSTGNFLFGVEFNDELKIARQRISSLKPVIRAIPFSEIVRLDYNNSTFYVGGDGHLDLPNIAVERDASQAAVPLAPRPSP